MNNFDWEKYLNHYEDLKIIDYNKESAIKHWNNYGKNENRIFFKKINMYLYNDFDWEEYLNYYDDLKIFKHNKESAINHWNNYGKNENRIYFKKECNKLINYDSIFNNIIISSVKNIKPHQIIDYLDIRYFENDATENSASSILLNNIKFLKSLDLFGKKNIEKYNKSNILFINNVNVSFDYLKYQKKTLNDLFEKYSNYDIIDLSCDRYDFYELINNEINVFKTDLNKTTLESYYVTNNGLKKILNNNDDLNIGYYSRPIFSFTNNKISNLWNSYYKVNNYWDKIFCINLGFDIEKRETMKKYCNLLNSNEEDFFYDGLLGLNLPELETLIDMEIYSEESKNKNIKKGAIGLNIAQSNIIRESLEKNYDYVLILEDDIYFDQDYFLVLDNIFERYKDIDILYLGNVNYEYNRMNELFDVIDDIKIFNNYQLLKPKKDLLEGIAIGGFFSVLLSKKALKILYERFTPINNISDVLLLNIAFDIKNDFSDNGIITKTNNNLNSYFLSYNLFSVILDKPSLTGENDYSILDNLKNNKSLQFLSKIKKLNFKIDNNYKIKIYIGDGSKIIYPDIIKVIIDKFIYYEMCTNFNNLCDIVIFSSYDNIELNEFNINIYIDQSGDKYENNNLIDISISNIKENIYNYNIYLPDLSDSLEKALGFKSKNICLVNGNNDEEIDNIDFYIKDLNINIPDNTIKRYLSDYLMKDDVILLSK
jgi:hypothetical protein